MKVDKRTLAKLEARRAARARGREYSPLEAIEPTRSAQALLICGHIVFALVLLLEGAALLFAIAKGDVFMVLGALAIIAGIVLSIDALSWALITLCIGLVLFAELVNTAIEAIVDLATQEIHPLAKRAKDIAAASVFMLAIMAAIVGLIVFGHALGLC